MTYQFQSTLTRPEGNGTWTFLNIPFDSASAFGSKYRIKVRGTIDGEPFRSTLMPDGNGYHFLIVYKSIRDKIGKSAGDTVSVEMEPDSEPRQLSIPDDFQSALSLNETASAFFEAMAPSHKKEYLDYITEPKSVDARMRRIDRAVAMIADNQYLK